MTSAGFEPWTLCTNDGCSRPLDRRGTPDWWNVCDLSVNMWINVSYWVQFLKIILTVCVFFHLHFFSELGKQTNWGGGSIWERCKNWVQIFCQHFHSWRDWGCPHLQCSPSFLCRIWHLFHRFISTCFIVKMAWIIPPIYLICSSHTFQLL